MPKISPKPDEAVDADQNLVKPDTYLETERAHKDWYHAVSMGGQRGKPKTAPWEKRKPVGTKKHSLRKEK